MRGTLEESLASKKSEQIHSLYKSDFYILSKNKIADEDGGDNAGGVAD